MNKTLYKRSLWVLEKHGIEYRLRLVIKDYAPEHPLPTYEAVYAEVCHGIEKLGAKDIGRNGNHVLKFKPDINNRITLVEYYLVEPERLRKLKSKMVLTNGIENDIIYLQNPIRV